MGGLSRQTVSCLKRREAGVLVGATGLSLRQGRVLKTERGHNIPRGLKISRDSNCCHEFNRLEFKPSQLSDFWTVLCSLIKHVLESCTEFSNLIAIMNK